MVRKSISSITKMHDTTIQFDNSYNAKIDKHFTLLIRITSLDIGVIPDFNNTINGRKITPLINWQVWHKQVLQQITTNLSKYPLSEMG